jgi:hypothetical protein
MLANVSCHTDRILNEFLGRNKAAVNAFIAAERAAQGRAANRDQSGTGAQPARSLEQPGSAIVVFI